MGELDGKTALVTGAGRGIGREIALALAGEGARVVVNDLGGDWRGEGTDDRPAAQVVDEIVDRGGEAVADFGSVTEAADAEAMVRAGLDRWGSIDIVVNNAGILRDRMIFKMTDDDWDSVIATHLRGHFLVTRAACIHWRELAKSSGGPAGGRIINTASESGLYGNAGQTNYAAAKAGIASFSLAVAREMGRYGVSSNAIAPRARTRMTEATFGEFGDKEGFDIWAPENVAPLIIFLASDAGAGYSGQLFVAGGGEYQVIEQFQPAARMSFDRPTTPGEVGAFIAGQLGAEAGPPAFPMIGLAVGANK